MFELDAKVVVDIVVRKSADFSKFGLIIMHCRSLMREATLCSVVFAKRQANKVAHYLARVSRFHKNPCNWFKPPVSI
ncbi:hypothetical protein PTKIN_Ptkin03bG0129800 [Pterospermum kingtungense]